LAASIQSVPDWLAAILFRTRHHGVTAMAKIISPVWSSVRGSIAGTTYLTTASGQIIARQRTRPTQPDSPNQNLAREALSMAAADWNNLTEVLRQAWNVAAVTFGETGRHLWIGGRSLLQYIGIRNLLATPIVFLTDAPTIGSRPSFNAVQSTPALPTSNTIEVTINNLQKVRTVYLIDVSPPFTQTRNFWKGPWATSQSVSILTASLGSQKAEIPNLVAGAWYMVRIRPVYAPVSPDTLKGVVAGTVHYLRATPTISVP
jgi:hypothetical protein